MMKTHPIVYGLFGVCALVIALYITFPILWLILASFKSAGELTRLPITILPEHFTQRLQRSVSGRHSIELAARLAQAHYEQLLHFGGVDHLGRVLRGDRWLRIRADQVPRPGFDPRWIAHQPHVPRRGPGFPHLSLDGLSRAARLALGARSSSIQHSDYRSPHGS